MLRLYSWHETRNHLWLIFEYCAGGDLYHLLEQDKKLPEKSVLRLGIELAAGLYYLHSKGVIYADLKPSNVILNEYSKLKLSDFGLARKVEAASVDPTQQSGTPSYMAPELFQKQGAYSYASDLWSLGCILFEMATGKPPFSSNSLKDLISQIIDGPTPKIDNFSLEFNNLIAGLLEKDPIKRISWEALRVHPCWEEVLSELQLPPQPQFEAYMISRGIHSSKLTEHSKGKISELRNLDVIPKVIVTENSKKPKEVDLMRVSQTVKKNLMKDKMEYNQDPGKDTSDIHLVSKDQELNFSEQVEEEKGSFDREMEGDAKEITPQLDGIMSGARSTKSSFKGHVVPRIIKKENSEDEHIKRAPIMATAPVSIHQSTESQSKSLDQLIMHPSDSTVKPIIGNTDIEKPLDLAYQSERLPFTPWRIEDVIQCAETQEFEEHIIEISRAISGPSSLHALAYFETITQNTNVANKLIDTMFITYLAKMLTTLKSSTMKVRVCSVIGTLIRHATIIENALAESGICELLQDALKDRHERVRRKAIAALGEYLFYAATQMDEEGACSAWNINSHTISILVKCIKPGEDEIVRYYTCKTIENIASQSMAAGCIFATPEIASLLANILKNPKNEGIETSAVVALSHISRLNPSIIPKVLDLLGFQNLCGALVESVSRIKQAFITLLIYAIKNSYLVIEKLHLQYPSGLIDGIASLLEGTSQVIKSKAALAIALLTEYNILWMPLLGTKGIYQHIDLAAKESSKYLLQCIESLCDIAEKCATETLSLILDDLSAKTASNTAKSFLTDLDTRLASNNLHKYFVKTYPSFCPNPRSSFNESMTLINTLKDMMKSLTLKTRIIPSKSIKSLCTIFSLSDSKEFEPIQFTILRIFEALAETPRLLPTYCDNVLQYFLPALLAKVYCKNEELRCACFKLVCDILALYMSDKK